MQILESLSSLVKAAVKFRNLQMSKILNINTNRIFPIPFKIMYISLKFTQFERSGYLYGVKKNIHQKMLYFPYKSIIRCFMLSTTIENENKCFANISIPFIILFLMKLIAQVNIIFFLKLKVLVLKYICKRNNPILSKFT